MKDIVAAITLGVLSLAQLSLAGCSHDLPERGRAQNLARSKALELQALQKRQSPTNLASQEQLLNPQQECAYYNYPPVQAIISQFPQTWEIAQILPNDNDARAALNAIVNDPAFPNLPLKGTPMGDFSLANYSTADPDCWWTWAECSTPKRQGIPADVITCNEPSTWGLTFDDGPNCTHNAFYNYLEQNSLKATMYFIGSNVMNWPLQAQRAIADGHDIGIHTWSHHYSTGLTNEQIFAELWYARKAIKDIVGVTPTTWRAPFGDVDDRIRFIAMKMGLTTVLWDNDMKDWQVQNSGNPNGLPTASVLAHYNQVFSESTQGQFNTHGTIVLTHEINGATMDIAMSQLPTVMSSFKHVMPITSCRNITNPFIERQYVFPNFQQWVSGQNKMIISNGTSSSSVTSSPTASSRSTSTMTRYQTSTVSRASGALAKSDTSSASLVSVGSSILVVAFSISVVFA